MLSTPNNQKIEQDIRDNKIKEGQLLKQSRHLKQWKQRWMVLTKTHLYSFQSKGIYKNPTETIPLLDIETTKAYYKDQYSKPFTFRVESKEVNLHMSTKNAEQKWAWMTAIEKMVDRAVHPDSRPDTHNLIRETIRMSSAVRNSIMKKEQSQKQKNGEMEVDSLMKKIKFCLDSNVMDFSFKPNQTNRKSNEQQNFKVSKNKKYYEATTVPSKQENTEQKQKTVEKIVEKIVEVPVEKIVYKEIKVPQVKQKVVEKIVEKPVYIEKKQNKGSNIQSKQQLVPELLAHLLQSPHQNPKPILDFTIYLLCEGPELYHPFVFELCFKSTAKTLFSEYLILMINQQADESRLNKYLRFMILIYENTFQQYFYSSDFRVFIDILLREMEMNRSQFNQYLIMMVLKTITEKDWWVNYNYRRNDLKSLIKEIQAYSTTQNQFLAGQLLDKI